MNLIVELWEVKISELSEVSDILDNIASQLRSGKIRGTEPVNWKLEGGN